MGIFCTRVFIGMRRVYITEKQKRRVFTETAMLFEDGLITEATVQEIHDKYYGLIPYETFMKVLQADPTYDEQTPDKMGRYGKWLLSLYQNLHINRYDRENAREYLAAFDKFKHRIPDNDIMHYKTLTQLYNAVRPFLDNPDQATSKADEARRAKQGAERVYEDSEWLVIVPHTKEAAIYYGKGTRWCTSSTVAENMFDEYNKHGQLYVNIKKHPSPGEDGKYQFHFEEQQFKDADNTDLETPIAHELNMTDGLINFYLKRYGALATVSLFEDYWEYLPIEDLNGYFKGDGPEATLYWYNNKKMEFKPVFYGQETYPGLPCSILDNFTVNGRYIPIKAGHDYSHMTIVNLYDTERKRLVFPKPPKGRLYKDPTILGMKADNKTGTVTVQYADGHAEEINDY